MIDSIAKFNEETQALDEIITRLQDLQKRNNAIVRIDDYFFEHKEFLLNSTWNYNERRLFLILSSHFLTLLYHTKRLKKYTKL